MNPQSLEGKEEGAEGEPGWGRKNNQRKLDERETAPRVAGVGTEKSGSP